MLHSAGMWLSSFNPEGFPELGEAALDDEHRLIGKHLADLHAAILTRRSVTDQRLVLYEALSYLRINCNHEEELMTRDLFPTFEEHKAAHQQLFQRWEWLDRILAAASQSRSLEALNEISNDLLQHVEHEDRLIVVWHRQCCRRKA